MMGMALVFLPPVSPHQIMLSHKISLDGHYVHGSLPGEK
jgi:hypothetical protein